MRSPRWRGGVTRCVSGTCTGEGVRSPRGDHLYAQYVSASNVAAWRLSTEDVQLFRHKRFLTLEDCGSLILIPVPAILSSRVPGGLAGCGWSRHAEGNSVNSARIYMSRYREPAPGEILRPADALALHGERAEHLGPNGERLALLQADMMGSAGQGCRRIITARPSSSACCHHDRCPFRGAIQGNARCVTSLSSSDRSTQTFNGPSLSFARRRTPGKHS